MPALPAALPAALAVMFACCGGDQLRIESDADPARVRIIARVPADCGEGLSPEQRGAQIRHWLELRLVGQDGELGPPVFGTHVHSDSALILQPKYALVRGERYRAVLRLPGQAVVEKEFLVPSRPKTKPAVVTHIFPSADMLPENLLKFYIHFSKPMREGRAIFDHITLLDEKDREIAGPWRWQELWSPDARRFTLWIHPGRIKTGVNLRETEGPVLHAGKEYRLKISGELRDAEGVPLGKAYVKRFRVAAPDQRRPDPATWGVSVPHLGTRDPLRLTFPESLDQSLLRRMLHVHDPAGNTLRGRIELRRLETVWEFFPEAPWKSGEYAVVIDGELEDLAGNTPLRVFDTDLDESMPELPQLRLPFKPVRGASAEGPRP